MGKREGRIVWRNLFDFVVIPYIEGKEAKEQEFTFEKLLEDFGKNKKESEEFGNVLWRYILKTN